MPPDPLSSTDGAGRKARAETPPTPLEAEQARAEQLDAHCERLKVGLQAERERTRVLEEALRSLFQAYDQSGLTDLRWFAPHMEAVRAALAAVAVEDGGNDLGYETRSARPVPAGEGASLRWHLIDAGEHGVKASRLPTTVHFHVPLAAVEFNGTVTADPTHPSWHNPEGER